MTTATVGKLTKDREHLQNERDRLVAEGEELRQRGHMTGDLGPRISELDRQITGLSVDLGEAAREYGHQQARKLPADAQYQATLAAPMADSEPWAQLAQANAALRAKGVIVPGLPLFATQQLGQVKLWLEQQVRAGTVNLATVPPALRAMVEK
jgi:hypothetical protein